MHKTDIGEEIIIFFTFVLIILQEFIGDQAKTKKSVGCLRTIINLTKYG